MVLLRLTCCLGLCVAAMNILADNGLAAEPMRKAPVEIIFDTDMGNDIDDALALGVLHALETRGECRLLAVTLSKDNDQAGPFCNAVNTFYGRGEIPIGVVRKGKTPEDSPYLKAVVDAVDSGKPRYPRSLLSGKDAPEAVALLRKTLAGRPDGAVTIVVVGFSTNLARLLDSPADDISPLGGRDLVAKKCRELVMMAGMFTPNSTKEYNVFIDAPAAKKVFADWPTPLVTSGFEIGLAIKYPAVSIEQDLSYVPHHPLFDAYVVYQKFPYDRETWDLTAVLYAVRPSRGYFGVSEYGIISVDDGDITRFAPAVPSAARPAKHRYLTVNAEQIARTREALVQLASQPPAGVGAKTKD